MLQRLLAHPLTRGLSVDDPRTTALRREIIQGKPFLRALYAEWYGALAGAIPEGGAPVLELGSGGGFLGDYLPGLVTSEVFPTPEARLVLDGRRLPFPARTLRGIVLVDVLHHVPDVGAFLAEADRCLLPGGVVAMVEPWVTPWSRLVYGRLHHEPFEPDAAEWTLPGGGPLSGANGALPWIVFQRDRALYEKRYPRLKIESIRTGYPFSYLASGGVSLRSLSPGWSYAVWRGLERLLAPCMGLLACFACIRLRKAARGEGA